MSKEIQYYEHLALIMVKTRGSRFTAATGLAIKERCSIGATALLTIYVLAWSVWLIAMPDSFTPETVQFFSALSVVASIAILVLSLLDYALGRAVRAEKLQQNALRISVLLRQLEREVCSEMPDINLVREIAAKYEEELVETQVNHTPSDYKKWQLYSVVAESSWQKGRKQLGIVAFDIWYYLSAIVVHVILVVAIAALTIWYLID